MSISTGTPKRYRNPDFYYYEKKTPQKINWIEFGIPTVDRGFILVRILPIDNIKDENLLLIGPDMKHMKLGSKHSIGIVIDVGGSQVVEDIEVWLEIKGSDLFNEIDGILFAMGRKAMWMRINKSKIKAFQNLGQKFNQLFKKENPIVERIQTTFFIDKADPPKN